MTYLSYPCHAEPVLVPDGLTPIPTLCPKMKPHVVTAEGVEEKHCYNCDTFKPLTAFYTDPSFWDGLHPYCKECKKQKNKEWLNAKR